MPVLILYLSVSLFENILIQYTHDAAAAAYDADDDEQKKNIFVLFWMSNGNWNKKQINNTQHSTAEQSRAEQSKAKQNQTDSRHLGWYMDVDKLMKYNQKFSFLMDSTVLLISKVVVVVAVAVF